MEYDWDMIRLTLVAGGRFEAIVCSLFTSVCFFMIALSLTDWDFKIQAFGISLEPASWVVHQAPWFAWHLARMANEAPEAIKAWVVVGDRVAGFAYLGTAAGAAMIAYPILWRRFGKYWWLVTLGAFSTVYVIGCMIALIYTGNL